LNMESGRTAIIALVGPTAIGKTELSLALAEKFSGEIIGVDSMQVYRYMDIGTAKPTIQERCRVPHHLIDVVDPDVDYSVGRYVEEAEQAIRLVRQNDHIPLLVGGTGMYLRGLLDGLTEFETADPSVRENLKQRLAERDGRRQLYSELGRLDPESAARIHPNDSQRLLRALEIYQTTGTPWSQHLKEGKKGKKFRYILKTGLTCDRDVLFRRINRRVEQMIEFGLEQEVRSLLGRGFHRDLKSMQALGYRHMVNYLAGNRTLADTMELLARDTRHYAKRQYTWFRSDPEIKWFQPSQQDGLIRAIERFLNTTQT
jgi:tRNA dimethylallyltransferase